MFIVWMFCVGKVEREVVVNSVKFFLCDVRSKWLFWVVFVGVFVGLKGLNLSVRFIDIILYRA